MKGLEMKSQTTSPIASEFSMLNLSEMEYCEIPQPSIQHKIPLSQETEEREDRKPTTVPTLILPDAGKTAKRFAELIMKAPNHTVDLIEASETLGVPKEDLYTITDVLKAVSVAVEEKQNKIRWVDSPLPEDRKRIRVHDSPALDNKKRLRVDEVTALNGKLRLSLPKRRRFVEVARLVDKLLRSPTSRKKKWKWLFLTETDINDFVVYQNDVLMMLSCPHEINFETPRPAKDGDGKQRKYGIMTSSDLGVTNNYFVSKLKSHDVILGDASSTSRSLPVLDDEQSLRVLRRKHNEESVRSLSNAKKINWNCSWLFLTEADINDFVVYHNDVLMMVNCPLNINLEIPRRSKGGYVKQRRFGVLIKCSRYERKITYVVSKLETHDVVNRGGTSRSSHDVVNLGGTSRSSHDVVSLGGTSRSSHDVVNLGET